MVAGSHGQPGGRCVGGGAQHLEQRGGLVDARAAFESRRVGGAGPEGQGVVRAPLAGEPVGVRLEELDRLARASEPERGLGEHDRLLEVDVDVAGELLRGDAEPRGQRGDGVGRGGAPSGLQEAHIAGVQGVAGERHLGQSGGLAQAPQPLAEGVARGGPRP